jgi:hypothetical protein
VVPHVSEELLVFLAAELRVDRSRLTPATRLQQDLGVDGEDGEELLLAFSRSFSVDLDGLDRSRYFGPEAGPNPFVWVWWLLTFSWPKIVPIRVKDLQASLNAGRWLAPDHAV